MKDEPFPPGPARLSLARAARMARDPLPMLLSSYEEYGPVFSIRALHGPKIFAIGPAANHHILVSNARNYLLRESDMGDFIPLLGDGLLTIDGDRHRRIRGAVLPAFHRESITKASETMIEEVEHALDRLQLGDVVDVFAWSRGVAIRIAMRALLGLDPDDDDTGALATSEFERALSFYATDYAARGLRGPGTPWEKLQSARAGLDRIFFTEIARRRRAGGGGGDDILGMLLSATDEDGHALSDQEVRDQAMTLLFAGHESTASTISFLLYELARHPDELAAICAEQNLVLGSRRPAPADLRGGLPRLEMALDETLRLYPAAGIAPRRTVARDEIAGVTIPAGARINYSSWVTQRLPELFPQPDEFEPERFTPERKAALPKGAYVPFGGGSRTCVGMRFGQMESRVIATLLLQRYRLELLPGYEMKVRHTATLAPMGGLPMTVAAR